MELSTSPKQNVIIFTVIFIATFCCHTGYGQNIPFQTVANALPCFNNKIYSGCDEAYRLTQSGNINVPPAATGLFCNGPCISETELVLNCVENFLSNSIFYNRATTTDIRYALSAGCSYTNQRGNFDVARYMGGEMSSGCRLSNFIGSYGIIVLVLMWCVVHVLISSA